MKVIIVHRNERTLDRCVEIVKEQNGEPFLINELSFEKSLRAAYQMAIDNDWNWMILLGGDQLLKDSALNVLKREVFNATAGVFRISGMGWDHLLMRERMLAPCAYKVSLLNKALEIDTTSKAKPESHILYSMKNLGFRYKIINDSLSVHDKDQFYRDIYRKGYNEGIKLRDYIYNVLPDILKSPDPDHKVFSLGIIDSFYNKKRDNYLELFGLTEKE